MKKLQFANAKTGTFLGGELRLSRNVGHVAKEGGTDIPVCPDGQKCPSHPVKAPQDALSAANVARSLLTGEFNGTRDFVPRPDAPPKLEVVAGVKDQGAGAPRAPALSDSFSLSSSSVILPGQSRDGSKSKHRKQTYWQSVASIGVQAAGALDYAHKQGVQHRDLLAPSDPASCPVLIGSRLWVRW